MNLKANQDVCPNPDCRDGKEIVPCCEGCGIVIGRKEEKELIDYRGHNICHWCRTNWEKKEERLGRTIEFNEYMGVKVRRVKWEESINAKGSKGELNTRLRQ